MGVCGIVAAAVLSGLGASAAQTGTDRTGTKNVDIRFVPTPQELVGEMLKLAQVGPNDVVYDLGSGDGRIPIAAAKLFGARGVGVELDPELVAQSTAAAKESGVADKVSFVEQDLFQADISAATVVALYLTPELNLRLLPKLNRELKPGTRILSNVFSMGNARPERMIDVNGRAVYLWTIPIAQ